MTNLFDQEEKQSDGPSPVSAPLADQMRPQNLTEIVGQDHLIGSDGTITQMINAGKLSSLILWGPPGTGKTSIARLLADEFSLHLEQTSAIFSGVADLKKIFAAAKERRRHYCLLTKFIDLTVLSKTAFCPSSNRAPSCC